MKLNNLLADLVVLNHKVSTIHWNVAGQCAHDLHELTDDLYKGLQSFIDEVGEKIKMTGEYPFGSLKVILENTVIQEIKAKNISALEAANMVVADLTLLEKTILAIKADHRIQPLFDELFLFIDKQRYLVGMTR